MATETPDLPPDFPIDEPSPGPGAPPPPPAPPALVALTFHVTNLAGQPAGQVLVQLSRDFGDGGVRLTDNDGFAPLAAAPGAALDWDVSGNAYQPAHGSLVVPDGNSIVDVALHPIEAPPSIPIGPSTARVRVTVTDATTGEPIAGAAVRSDHDAGFGTLFLTDATGVADVRAPFATIVLAIAADGFTGTQLAVNVPSDIAVPIALVPLPGRDKRTPVPTNPPPIEPPVTPPPGPGGGPGGPGGGGRPLDDSLDSPPRFTAPIVEYDARGGVRSIRDRSLVALDVPSFGVSAGGLIGIIISGIAALFGGGGSGSDVSKISGRIDQLGAFALQLAQALDTFATRSTHLDGQTGNLFDRIVGSVLGPIINALAAVIRGGAGDLTKLFGPISSALKKLLDTVRHIYNTWLKPILHAIDITRQILRVLNALGLEFAGTLDAQLGRLEGKLTRPLLLVQAKINELRNEVNKIVTLNGALQRVTLLKSLTTHATCVQRQLANAPLASSTTPIGPVAPAAPAQTPDEMVSDLTTFAQSGGGPMADAYAAWTSAT